jgi:hypothetical protein
MRCHHLLITATLATAFAAGVANACIIQVRTQLTDVQYADVVVVGRIVNYHLVLDQKWRDRERQQFFKSGKWLNPKEYFNRPSGYITDYARFDIQVDEVLKGKAAKTLTATWDASTFGEPEQMPPGPYLIALRLAGSKAPPMRAPSATIFPDPEPGTPTVVHPPCASAFIFDSKSQEATNVRLILQGKPLPKPPAPPPEPTYIRVVWVALPTDEDRAQFYPPRAHDDEVDGSATVDCVATKLGRVTSCWTLSETPAGYRFGEATIKIVQAKARLKPGTYHAGDRLKFTFRWQFDELPRH